VWLIPKIISVFLSHPMKLWIAESYMGSQKQNKTKKGALSQYYHITELHFV